MNDVWIHLECDDAIAHELSDYFCFDVPGAHFMPAARRGWDRKIRLFKLRTHTLYKGLIPRVIEFAAQRSYPVVNNVEYPDPLLKGPILDEWFGVLNLPFPLRNYQAAALRVMLDTQRGIIVSPTGSGKSYIIYLITELLFDKKVLIVVPTIGLVSQMAGDFKTYNCTEPIQTIQAGLSKMITERLTVSTWQSIYEQPKEWFAQFNMVIVDEVHLAKSQSLKELMEKCETTPWRFGFTGTLDQSQCHRLILEGLFGTVTKVATTNELIKAKQLTPPRVIVCVLEYPEDVPKGLAACDLSRGNRLHYQLSTTK